jgi:hypothetical protein
MDESAQDVEKETRVTVDVLELKSEFMRRILTKLVIATDRDLRVVEHILPARHGAISCLAGFNSLASLPRITSLASLVSSQRRVAVPQGLTQWSLLPSSDNAVGVEGKTCSWYPSGVMDGADDVEVVPSPVNLGSRSPREVCAVMALAARAPSSSAHGAGKVIRPSWTSLFATIILHNGNSR